MPINTGSVTVAITVTPVFTAPDDFGSNRSVVITNTGAAVVFLGSSSVTTGTGKSLAAGASITLTVDPGEDVYGIVAAGTNTVDFIAT